jgi:hypothetical protein
VGAIIEKLDFEFQNKSAILRSFMLLDVFKTLLSERNHVLLYYNMTQMFPRLFNFKETGVLFMDKQS